MVFELPIVWFAARRVQPWSIDVFDYCGCQGWRAPCLPFVFRAIAKHLQPHMLDVPASVNRRAVQAQLPVLLWGLGVQVVAMDAGCR